MDTVADIIGGIESNNNPAAIRYEPKTDARAPNWDDSIAHIIEANQCDKETARMIWASSWGEFQLMGFNLYAAHICGYNKPIAAYLVSESDQHSTFADFLAHLNTGVHATDSASVFNDANVRMSFARAYNGPGTPFQYASKIAHAIAP